MNKQVAIAVMAALAIGVIAVGFLYMQKGSELKDAESEISSLQGNVSTLQGTVSGLQGNVSTLEGTVSSLEGNVSTLETELGNSEATVANLETDLANTRDDLQAQEDINSAQSEELSKIKSPRHFESLEELEAWLAQDNTDVRYAYVNPIQRSYILQVRALRDGYLLSVNMFVDVDGTTTYYWNQAVINGIIYMVFADDDSVFELDAISIALTLYPLSPGEE